MMRNLLGPVSVALFSSVLGVSAALAGTGLISGTAAYRERIALPPGAVLSVQLLDVSRMDVAATVMSSMRYAMDTVPADFSLTYDEALIDDRMRYTVSATIEHDGKVLFRTTEAYPVLTQDADSHVDLVLTKSQNTSAIRLTGRWDIVEVSGEALNIDPLPQVDFSEPGRVGLKGACNSFVGEAEANGSNLTFSETMAGTMKACAPGLEELDRKIIAALQMSSRIERGEGELAFVGSDGKAVLRMTAAN